MSKQTSDMQMDMASFLTPSRKIRSYDTLNDVQEGSHSLRQTTASTNHKIHAYDDECEIEVRPFNPENFLADQYYSQTNDDMDVDSNIEDAICNQALQIRSGDFETYSFQTIT